MRRSHLGSVASAIVLTVLVRRRAVTFRWVLVGAVLLIAGFVSWLLLVLPVNRAIAAALASSPEGVTSLWAQLRDRWEYGHATGFALHLAGFCALVMSVVRHPAADHPDDTGRIVARPNGGTPT